MPKCIHVSPQYIEDISTALVEICKPLKTYFGISHFGYAKYYADKNYFHVSNDHRFNTQYIANIKDALPFFDQKAQIVFKDTKMGFKFATWPRFSCHSEMDFFIEYNHWNGISIVRIDGEDLETWWFAADKDNEKLREFYKAHPDILEKFIKYFINKHPNIYNAPPIATFDKIDLSLIGSLKTKEEREAAANLKIQNFLREIVIDSINVKSSCGIVRLSKREIECLSLVAQGKSMKEIAYGFSISNRTVENHLANVKEKTGYKFKSELVLLYYDQIHRNL